MDVLGQLTSSVAHDFNNVLTVLDCNIDLLKSQENLQEEQKNLLDNCIEAVELGSNLSNRLTKFARVEPLAETRVDLNAWIDSFGKLLNRSVGKGISIEYVLPADTMPVLVDATLLGVALLNLVTNARDAMPKGGKITVSLDKTNIDEAVDPVRGKDEKRTYALLQVSDTGTGMSPKIKERALEAFFTTKGEDEGTGLGLNTVKDLAQSADGFVQIESARGKGTAVKIFLPLYEEKSP
jgi:signal transduction histidine kinase